MKLLKKIGIGCGGILLITILSFGGIYLFLQTKMEKYDTLTDPYFAEYIPLLSTWDPKQTRAFWAPEVEKSLDPIQLRQLFTLYSRLGKLHSYAKPQFLQISSNTNIPYPSSIHYLVQADYENGKADLNFHLVSTKDGGLKIWGLKINSDAFLPKVETELPTDEPAAPPKE